MEREKSKIPPLMMIIPKMKRKAKWNLSSSPSQSEKNTNWPPRSRNTRISASATDLSKYLCWSAAFAIWEMSNTDALTKAVTGSRTADSMTHALCFYMNNMSTFSWQKRTRMLHSTTSNCWRRKRRKARKNNSNSASLCGKRKWKPRKTPVQAERKLRFQKRKTKRLLNLMRRRRGNKTSLKRE